MSKREQNPETAASLKCARSACQTDIVDGHYMFWIANQPQFMAPNDCRPYCIACGKKIIEFAASQRDNFAFAVVRHPCVPTEDIRFNCLAGPVVMEIAFSRVRK